MTIRHPSFSLAFSPDKNNNGPAQMLLAMLVWLCLLGMLLCHIAWQQWGWPQRPLGYRRLTADPAARPCRSAAKPAWVRKELIRLKAAKPKAIPKNLVWALDLTGKGTLDGRTRLVLGIVEHASRAALCLEALRSKSSWTLISKLIEAIRRYGKPYAVRTDNEAVFTSRTFRLVLALLGIRHQRTDPGCPWQNGRAERFFGTLKGKLDRLAVDSVEALSNALVEFRFFYNHVRPHQNLAGLTPAEAWAGDAPFTRLSVREYWFEAWDGLLSGYYLRR